MSQEIQLILMCIVDFLSEYRHNLNEIMTKFDVDFRLFIIFSSQFAWTFTKYIRYKITHAYHEALLVSIDNL